MPYDAWSLATIAASGSLLLLAYRFGSRPLSVGLVVGAALLIRTDAAYQRSLHVWDESFHALVAKNLIESPLRPVLYRDPVLPYDPHDWTANHVWLHKPPGALWLMAGSMALLGINELALRLPSVLMSTVSVLLTFLIGRRLVPFRVALLAAAFQAVNGFLIALAAGRRVADHVDTALIFFVELAVWCVVAFVNTQHRRWLVLAGAATGAGLLTKSWPALIVAPVAFALLAGSVGRRMALLWCGAVVVIAAGINAPWAFFTFNAYPREAAGEALYTLRHMWSAIEGSQSAWWAYLADVPRIFGEASPIALVVAAFAAFRGRQRGLGPLFLWAAVTYAVFSVFMTRLPAYVMIAAPATFLLLASGVDHLRRALPPSGAWRASGRLLGGLIVLLSGRQVLEPSGPLEARERSPAFARELKQLENRLGASEAVLFNMPKPIDAMFYSRYTAYARLPTAEEVRDLVTRGRPVVIYQRSGDRVTVPRDWQVIELEEAR